MENSCNFVSVLVGVVNVYCGAFNIYCQRQINIFYLMTLLSLLAPLPHALPLLLMVLFLNLSLPLLSQFLTLLLHLLRQPLFLD